MKVGRRAWRRSESSRNATGQESREGRAGGVEKLRSLGSVGVGLEGPVGG